VNKRSTHAFSDSSSPEGAAGELAEIRKALADAERRLRDARLLHAMKSVPTPAGVEEDVAVLRAEELRLRQFPGA
jgi:hypothetical protein